MNRFAAPPVIPTDLIPGRDYEPMFYYNGIEYQLRHLHTGKIPVSGKKYGYQRNCRVQIHYGFDMKFYYEHNYRNGFMPSFHIVSDVYAPNGRDIGGGASPQGIKRFVEADVFHLWDWPGTPMYYIENGVYALQCALGVGEHMQYDKKTTEERIESFKRTIGFGMAPGDDEILTALLHEFGYDPNNYALVRNNPNFSITWQTEQVKKWLRQEIRDKAIPWLEGRKPHINEKFVEMMVKLKVAIPSTTLQIGPVALLEAGDAIQEV